MSFRKELLPHAGTFYNKELGQLSRPDRKGWRKGRCPFHKSKTGKSFSVHIDGGFYCHGCGVKGDLISFVKQRYGLSFSESLKYLGIEQDHPDSAHHATRARPKPKSAACLLAEAVVKEHQPTETQVLRTMYGEAKDRLTELGRGTPEAYPDEAEHCWSVMAVALDDLRLSGWEGIEL
jgi:hypothetical protein